MANTKTKKLQEQLKLYESELEKYEKELLANDGKIEMEEQEMFDSTRKLIERINNKLSTEGDTSMDDSTEKIEEGQIPKAFKKGYARLNLTISNLEEKVKELKSLNKLEASKDKMLKLIEKVRENFSSIEDTYADCDVNIKKECSTQIRDLASQLDKLKKSISDESFLEKVIDFVTPEKIQEIKGRFSSLKDKLKKVANR